MLLRGVQAWGWTGRADGWVSHTLSGQRRGPSRTPHWQANTHSLSKQEAAPQPPQRRHSLHKREGSCGRRGPHGEEMPLRGVQARGWTGLFCLERNFANLRFVWFGSDGFACEVRLRQCLLSIQRYIRSDRRADGCICTVPCPIRVSHTLSVQRRSPSAPSKREAAAMSSSVCNRSARMRSHVVANGH